MKRWINTKVISEWNEETQRYETVSSEGYWYEGEVALADEPICCTPGGVPGTTTYYMEDDNSCGYIDGCTTGAFMPCGGVTNDVPCESCFAAYGGSVLLYGVENGVTVDCICGGCDDSENLPEDYVSGCTDNSIGFYTDINNDYTCGDGTQGCYYDNYNPNADYAEECNILQAHGCDNPAACNYNSEVVDDYVCNDEGYSEPLNWTWDGIGTCRQT